MSKRCGSWITWVTLAVAVGTAAPSHAITGTVRVTVAKAGFIVGAGGGKGVLTFRHRNYPFTVQGLSLGLTAGASINKLVGRAEYINELSDFAGTYSVMGVAAMMATERLWRMTGPGPEPVARNAVSWRPMPGCDRRWPAS